MNAEQLSKWSSIAEILSSIAILGTLVLVLVEVRQNTDALEQNGAWMRLASLDAGYEQNSVWRRMLLTDSQLFSLWENGCASQLSAEVQARYEILAREYLILMRNVGERALALGGSETLRAQAAIVAAPLKECPNMRAIFTEEFESIENISPEWYDAVAEFIDLSTDGG